MPQIEPQVLSSHKQDLQQWLQRCCLLDDEFLCKCFERNPQLIQFILRIVLERPDLQVQESFCQFSLQNLQGRSVCFDILAADTSGKQYNIEMQRANSGAHVKRARYNSSLLDASLSVPGEQYHQLNEAYVIFITEKDPLHQGLPICHIERIITETGQPFQDGSHIIYASAQYQDETPLGRLMHDLSCSDPEQMHYPFLADNVRHFKQTQEGVRTMSGVFQEFAQEVAREVAQDVTLKLKNEIALHLLKDGTLSLEKIAESTNLSMAEVQALAAQREPA